MFKNSKKTPFGQITINFGKYPVSKHVKKTPKNVKNGVFEQVIPSVAQSKPCFQAFYICKITLFQGFWSEPEKTLIWGTAKLPFISERASFKND